MYALIKRKTSVIVVVNELTDSCKFKNSVRYADTLIDDLYFHISEIGSLLEIGDLCIRMEKYFKNFEQWSWPHSGPCVVYIETESIALEYQDHPYIQYVDNYIGKDRVGMRLTLGTLDKHIIRTDRRIINDEVRFVQCLEWKGPLWTTYFDELFDGLERFTYRSEQDLTWIEGFEMKNDILRIHAIRE